MEEMITEAFRSGNATAIICALAVYLIIYLQRNSTGKKRDGENENIKAELTILKNEIEGLKSLDLASKLAQIQTDIEWIKEKLR